MGIRRACHGKNQVIEICRMPFAGANAPSRALTDHDILQAERSLYRVRQDLVAKRDELGRLGATDAGSASGRGWMGRVFGGKEDQGGFGRRQ